MQKENGVANDKDGFPIDVGMDDWDTHSSWDDYDGLEDEEEDSLDIPMDTDQDRFDDEDDEWDELSFVQADAALERYFYTKYFAEGPEAEDLGFISCKKKSKKRECQEGKNETRRRSASRDMNWKQSQPERGCHKQWARHAHRLTCEFRQEQRRQHLERLERRIAEACQKAVASQTPPKQM